MKIRVDTIPEEGEHIEGGIEPSEINLDLPGYSLEEAVVFAGHAAKADDGVYVEGTIRGTVHPECSRCLTTFEMPLELDMNVVYVPEEERTGKQSETLDPDSNLSFYEGDSIDLLREIKDLILTSLPIKPICRPDCKGICPQCGADLNAAACKCEQHRGVSPFDKLKELRSRLEGR
jgi:uncharacterized protein